MDLCDRRAHLLLEPVQAAPRRMMSGTTAMLSTLFTVVGQP